MPTVRVPSPLLRLTAGVSTVTVGAGDVRGVLVELESRYPGLAERLLDGDGELRRFVHVFVGDEDVRSQQGLDTPVGASDTVAIVPAVAGGCGGLSGCSRSPAAARDRRRSGR